MTNIPSISNRIYYSTEFKKTLAAMFVCFAMTLGFLAITEPVFATKPTPTLEPGQCQVCHRLGNGRYQTDTINCDQVQHFLARHPGSCAGPCPCQITHVQNP